MSNQKNTGQFDLSLLFCARLEPEKIGQGLKRLKPKLQIFIEFLLSKRKENQGSTLMGGRKKQNKVYKQSQEGYIRGTLSSSQCYKAFSIPRGGLAHPLGKSDPPACLYFHLCALTVDTAVDMAVDEGEGKWLFPSWRILL